MTKRMKKNLIKIIILSYSIIFIIGWIYINFSTFYNKDIVTVETTITNIEQYSTFKTYGKNDVGIKINFIDENNNEYEYKGKLTNKVYNIGDSAKIAYLRSNPENIIIGIREYRISLIIFLISIILIILIYFKFIKNKKSLVLYVLFMICFFVNLLCIYNIINALYIKMNYLKTDAYVVDTYPYSYTSYNDSFYEGNVEIDKTGAIYKYNVNEQFYKANALNVSSKTELGDTKTIYYSSKNPMYYAFGVDFTLIVSIIALLLITGIAILFNPFVDVLKRKKKIIRSY